MTAAPEPHECDHGFVTVWYDSDRAELPIDPEYQGLVHYTAVHPCPTCRPGQYDQWKNGCFKPNHEPCDLCQSRRGRG